MVNALHEAYAEYILAELYPLKSVRVRPWLYAAETWTLLAEDVRTLEAFHVRYQHPILAVRCIVVASVRQEKATASFC